jgi:hypothetical protein
MRPTMKAVLAWGALASCAPQRPAEVPPTTEAAPPTTQAPPLTTLAVCAPDAWLGRWNGVEGTYLELARAGDSYVVTIADLDGPRTYEGAAVRDHVEFLRAGRTESVRHASGRETGMKWLADETNCLVVTVGSEGYCRRSSPSSSFHSGTAAALRASPLPAGGTAGPKRPGSSSARRGGAPPRY